MPPEKVPPIRLGVVPPVKLLIAGRRAQISPVSLAVPPHFDCTLIETRSGERKDDRNVGILIRVLVGELLLDQLFATAEQRESFRRLLVDLGNKSQIIISRFCLRVSAWTVAGLHQMF